MRILFLLVLLNALIFLKIISQKILSEFERITKVMNICMRTNSSAFQVRCNINFFQIRFHAVCYPDNQTASPGHASLVTLDTLENEDEVIFLLIVLNKLKRCRVSSSTIRSFWKRKFQL